MLKATDRNKKYFILFFAMFALGIVFQFILLKSDTGDDNFDFIREIDSATRTRFPSAISLKTKDSESRSVSILHAAAVLKKIKMNRLSGVKRAPGSFTTLIPVRAGLTEISFPRSLFKEPMSIEFSGLKQAHDNPEKNDNTIKFRITHSEIKTTERKRVRVSVLNTEGLFLLFVDNREYQRFAAENVENEPAITLQHEPIPPSRVMVYHSGLNKDGKAIFERYLTSGEKLNLDELVFLSSCNPDEYVQYNDRLERAAVWLVGEGENRPALLFHPGDELRYKVRVGDESVLSCRVAEKQTGKKKSRDSIEVILTKNSKEISRDMLSAHGAGKKKDGNMRYILNLAAEGNVELIFRHSAGAGEEAEPLYLVAPVLRKKRSERSKNVILISLDTLRADRLGCYGHTRPTSPAIDSFASKSILFSNCFSSAPGTLPSHMAMLTGRYPSGAGYIKVPPERMVSTNRIAWNVHTIAEHLKTAGYLTHGITDGGQVKGLFGFRRGFDSYSDSHKNPEGKGIRANVDEAIKWLDENGSSKFFLFFHSYEIHKPYTRDFFLQELETGAAARDKALARYDSGIRYADAEIGRLLDYLKSTGLFENTLIIITSDHGENFRYKYKEHEWGHHGTSLYDPEIHVPLIIGGSVNFEKGKSIEPQVRLVDIAPAILDYVGIEPLNSMRGISLFSALGNNTGSLIKERIVYAEGCYGREENVKEIKGIRAGSGKYSVTYRFVGKDGDISECEEFYNLKTDPDEMTNLAKSSGEVTRRYREIYKSITKNLKEVIKNLERGLILESLHQGLYKELKALGYL